jgi:hypothetical protein
MQFENDGTNGTIRTEGATIFRAGGSTERMRITSGGTIKMTDENGGVPILQVRNFSTAATGAFTDAYAMEFRGATTTGSTGGMMLLHMNEANDARATLNVSDSNGIFATFTNGKVGIGDTNPASKLVVAGRVQANSGSEPWAFVSNPTSGNYGGFLMQYGNNTKGVCYYNSNSIIVGSEGAAIPLRLTTNGNYVAHFSGTTGNMHIGGISDQDAKLYVTGGTTLAGTSNTSEGAIRMYGDRKLPQANYFVKRNYNLAAGAGGALYSIARQWHDHANWGLGNINVIMWGIYYGLSQFNKADFSCRYGYGGGGADVQANFNPGGIAVPAWTAATQVSGNTHYRDLQIQIPAYYQISFEIISPGLQQTYNLSNQSGNSVYLYPH